MAIAIASRKVQQKTLWKVYGNASAVLAIIGLMWFVICFSAKEARWWNSLWFFLLIFVFAVSLGFVGRRNMCGIFGIIFGSFGLLGVGFLLYVRYC
jgi:uncharacterized membrane protein